MALQAAVAQQQVQTEQQVLAQKQIQAQQAVVAAQGQADAQVALSKGQALQVFDTKTFKAGLAIHGRGGGAEVSYGEERVLREILRHRHVSRDPREPRDHLGGQVPADDLRVAAGLHGGHLHAAALGRAGEPEV